MTHSGKLIIAIDGVSASGKGTLAKALAEHYNCSFLPTGNIYRLVAKKILEGGVDYNNVTEIKRIVQNISPAELLDPSLSSNQLSVMSSKISAVEEIRMELNEFQRQWIRDHDPAIVEGRDIGTVIFPEANVKIFLTADLGIRAKRRTKDLGAIDASIDQKTVSESLEARDFKDSTRKIAPLKKADDAIILDSTNLTIPEMVKKAIGIIEKKIDK